jgi:predicted RNase H-like nuclease (RuvC/YqgF family)
MGKIKEQLAGIAALIGVLGAIGAGFVKYGEMQEQLNNVSGIDISPLQKEISEQNVKIATLEEKISKLTNFDSSNLENEISLVEDKLNNIISNVDKRSLINEKTIKVLDLEIQELKASNKNPLAN